MINKQNKISIDNIILGIILLIAAFLRFAYLGEIEHNVDHAYPIWQALQTIDRGVFPLVGQGSSILFEHPALTGYLYVPFMAMTRNIISVYLFVITLNTFAVLLTYHAIQHLLGSRITLIAAFLIAVNPWVIEYSRYSWPPALLVFFLSLTAWLIIPVLMGSAKHPTRRLILSAISITLMTQTTLFSFFVIAPIGILMLIFRKRIPWKSALIGFIIFAISTGIYAGGLYANRDSVQARLTNFGAENTTAQFKPDAAEHAFRLVSGAGYDEARGIDTPQNDAELRQNLSFVATSAVGLLMLLGIAVSVLTIFRPGSCQHPPEITESQARDAAIIMLIWFGFPILAMSYNGVIVHPYYLLVTLPTGFALGAWGIGYVLNPFNRSTIIALLILALPFGGLMGINNFRNSQETTANPGIHDLGALPIDWGLELGQRINQHLPENAVLFADVDEWTMNSLAGSTFRLIRDVRAPEVAIIPNGGGLYLVAHPPETDNSFIPDFAQRVDTLELPDGWTFTYDLYPSDVTAQFDAEAIHGEKWLSFLNHDLEQSGDEITLTIFWHVDTLTTEINEYAFVPFVHVYDDGGERIAIIDGQAISGANWREGDVHLHRLTFDLPDGATSLQIGQFDGVKGENIIFILEDGTYTPTITLELE